MTKTLSERYVDARWPAYAGAYPSGDPIGGDRPTHLDPLVNAVIDAAETIWKLNCLDKYDAAYFLNNYLADEPMDKSVSELDEALKEIEP